MKYTSSSTCFLKTTSPFPLRDAHNHETHLLHSSSAITHKLLPPPSASHLRVRPRKLDVHVQAKQVGHQTLYREGVPFKKAGHDGANASRGTPVGQPVREDFDELGAQIRVLHV